MSGEHTASNLETLGADAVSLFRALSGSVVPNLHVGVDPGLEPART